MSLVDELMALEHRLARGRGADYQEVLADDALVVVPGAVLDKEACVAAMDDSPGWDRVDLRDPRLLGRSGVATVVYEFEGWRGDWCYRAVLASTYAEEQDGRRLVLHQQTPAPEGG